MHIYCYVIYESQRYYRLLNVWYSRLSHFMILLMQSFVEGKINKGIYLSIPVETLAATSFNACMYTMVTMVLRVVCCVNNCDLQQFSFFLAFNQKQGFVITRIRYIQDALFMVLHKNRKMQVTHFSTKYKNVTINNKCE